jgi:L-asparaginase
MKRIDMFTSGGTISSLPILGDEGVQPSLGAAALLAGVRVPDGVELVFHEYEPRPSNWMTFDDAKRFAREIDEVAEHGSAGALIVQGTDTLDEIPFAVDLLATSGIPIAFTGAMRTPAHAGADGAANLEDSLHYLAAASGSETVVILNSEVHPAAAVRKSHTFHTNAFVSAPVGPVGAIVEREFFAYRPGVARSSLGLAPRGATQVLLLTAALGDEFSWLPEAFLAAGYHGLVVEGMGNGHTNAAFARQIKQIAAEHPVVIVSRTGGFPLAKHSYNYDGSEVFFARSRAVVSDVCDGLKARIMLTLAIEHAGVAGALDCYLELEDELYERLRGR